MVFVISQWAQRNFNSYKINKDCIAVCANRWMMILYSERNLRFCSGNNQSKEWRRHEVLGCEKSRLNLTLCGEYTQRKFHSSGIDFWNRVDIFFRLFDKNNILWLIVVKREKKNWKIYFRDKGVYLSLSPLLFILLDPWQIVSCTIFDRKSSWILKTTDVQKKKKHSFEIRFRLMIYFQSETNQ